MRDSIQSVWTHPESSLAVTISEREIWFWDAARGVLLNRFKRPEEINYPFSGNMTHQGTLLLVGRGPRDDSCSILEFRIPGGELIRRSRAAETVNYDDLAFSADGRRMLVARRGELSLFDLSDGKKQWSVAYENQRDSCLAFVPGQPWVTAIFESEVTIMHVADGKAVATPEARSPKANPANDSEMIRSLHVSPAGDWLAVCTGEGDVARLVVWDLPGRLARFSAPFRGKVQFVHPDGKSLLARDDRFLNTVEMTKGRVIRSVAVPWATEVGFIRQGKSLVYDAGDTLSCVDAETGRDLPNNPMPPDRIADLKFRDAHRLVGRLDTWGGWVEWDLRTGDAKLVRPAAAIGMTPIAMTPDLQQLVYRSDHRHFRLRADGTVSGKSAAHINEDQAFVRGTPSVADPAATVVAYREDGRWMAHDFNTGADRVLSKTKTRQAIRDFSRPPDPTLHVS